VKKSQSINLFIDHGQFHTKDIHCTKQLIDSAGGMLDASYSHEICGCPIFRTADGKWHQGSVEFTFYPANQKAILQELLESEYCECHDCGHLEPLEYIKATSSEDGRGGGICEKCGNFSYLITKTRASEIAGLTKPKRHCRVEGPTQ